MTRIAVIVGSTRPGRRARVVADWVYDVASRQARVDAGEVSVAVVDLADFALPLLDEPTPPLLGTYRQAHTVRWAEEIDGYDGFVFVTPEYNHAIPGALKNAIDFLFAEWNHKAAGFVSYGVHGGTRSVEQLRLVMGELMVADVRSQVALSVFTDFEIADPTEPGVFAPAPHREEALGEMLAEVFAWAGALAPLRTGPQRAAA